VKFAKALVVVNGILFVGFGLGFIVAPSFFSSFFTGGVPATSSAAIDLRATYGGLGLGTGVWFLLCAKSNLRLGVLGAIAVLASIVLGRVIGLAVDGTPNIFMYLFLLAEVVFLLASLFALKMVGK
jgi:hypothetical protein